MMKRPQIHEDRESISPSNVTLCPNPQCYSDHQNLLNVKQESDARGTRPHQPELTCSRDGLSRVIPYGYHYLDTSTVSITLQRQ